MATTKVSALASKGTLGGSEEILINDGGTSKKSTVTAVRTGITDATKLPLAGGQMTGNITMSGSQTVDGRDVSADGTQLDTNTSAIATKAPIASPTFTGTVAIPNIGNLEAAVAANTAKTGITTSQANAITANTAKNGISSSQAAAITANTAKKGLSPCFIRLDSPASGIVSRESGLGIGSTNPFIPSLNHAVTIDSRDGIKFSNLSVGIYKVQVNVIADASRHNPVTITGRIGRNAVIQRQFINVGSFCDFSFVDLVNITDAREELFFTLTSASSTTVTVLPGTTIYLEKI